jgi:hypothetical protein
MKMLRRKYANLISSTLTIRSINSLFEFSLLGDRRSQGRHK